MALTSRQDALYRWLKSAVPSWLFGGPNAVNETWEAMAVVFEAVQAAGERLLDTTYLLRATGSWLDVHAREHGTSRRLNETDDSLRERLRTPEDAVTEPALEDAADAILTAHSSTTGAKIVSLRMDCARFWTDPDTGRRHSYLSRGYRMAGSVWPLYPGGSAVWPGDTSDTGRQGSGIIMILPYGTTVAASGAVVEMLRVKASGGFWRSVETRGVP